jgi:hypothetical protein
MQKIQNQAAQTEYTNTLAFVVMNPGMAIWAGSASQSVAKKARWAKPVSI